ncbi:hypothetical protein GCM10009759_64810 [Kitasatospora saccharophila]|uniref:Ricin B lectin domain-containing protein n=1 Tax=Kitasatospora saccharophila TaxID=407973 RepID=A0ABP5JP21_9ACTN
MKSLYQFVDTKSGYCLDLPGYESATAGSRVSIYPCNSQPWNDNQEWYLEDATGNLEYEIVNYKNGLCLDVAGWAGDAGNKANDVPLTVYTCENGGWGGDTPGYDDHLWRLVP